MKTSSILHANAESNNNIELDLLIHFLTPCFPSAPTLTLCMVIPYISFTATTTSSSDSLIQGKMIAKPWPLALGFIISLFLLPLGDSGFTRPPPGRIITTRHDKSESHPQQVRAPLSLDSLLLLCHLP